MAFIFYHQVPNNLLPSARSSAGTERMLRRERGRNVNSHRIQAEITMLAVTDLTDLGGIHAGTFVDFFGTFGGGSAYPRQVLKCLGNELSYELCWGKIHHHLAEL